MAVTHVKINYTDDQVTIDWNDYWSGIGVPINISFLPTKQSVFSSSDFIRVENLGTSVLVFLKGGTVCEFVLIYDADMLSNFVIEEIKDAVPAVIPIGDIDALFVAFQGMIKA